MAENEVNNDGVQFFEGVEKLLEVWFTRADSNVKNCDLRKIPRQKLEELLEIVRCEIISAVHNEQLDAYVLSESSMFVSKRRFILKTCGTTTPLQCLKPLLLLVNQYAGFDEVEDVFYSRKNYKRPELQLMPHRNFEQEVELLDTFFKAEPDQTLEILMSDLDPAVMAIFTREESSSAAEATQKSGIDKLLPNMELDDFLFEPCGYSMNGISKQGCYMTIHITPEPEFSYVSFESNVPQSSYKEVISRVISTFRPGKFVLTVFANKASVAADAPRELERAASFGEWLRHDIQYCRFKSYDLTYALYSKFPS
ncbi:hypothetical protein B566_EDAN014073 [Ephemera danica]|nr:hypothetical protein B566_EDAN014073 [Ephemera danica]